ncbi:MAG: acyl-ACP--UDP-N-acetylglucosamine O-acyltransferase [Acidiferrobacterales bacterium]|nr:acyl-ACP--UDP-N-acetylglucosamine O-acyltransferase [Acidiferrobacterales bacterium]
MIHPKAIVDPKVKLGEDVHIGAYSVIGADVEIGDQTWIGPHVVINGPTVIGRENKIYQFSSIGEAPQHLGYAGEPTRLEIGDRNVIREYCTLNRGTEEGHGVTRIGSDNFFMAYVHIAHDCHVGNHTIFANCASLAGHVSVDDYAFLGGFTGVHQFCRVGAYCMTGIATITFKDIPPYVLVSGNTAVPHGINVRGLKRRQFSVGTIAALRDAYKVVYRSGLQLRDALTRLQDSECTEVRQLAAFIQSSERGIIR